MKLPIRVKIGTRLPFPSGGALPELYPSSLLQNIEGLEQGLWYANLHTRQYEQGYAAGLRRKLRARTCVYCVPIPRVRQG